MPKANVQAAGAHMTQDQYEANYTQQERTVKHDRGIVEVLAVTGNEVTSFKIVGMPYHVSGKVILPKILTLTSDNIVQGNLIVVHPINCGLRQQQICLKYISVYTEEV